MNDRSKAILDWYQGHVRAIVEEHSPERLSEFDRESQRVSELATRAAETVSICFLGNAAVGKSTLLNALVSGKDVLLPAGGVGPLTAQATSVEFAESPFFEANYQSKEKLWNVVFALECMQVANVGKHADAETLEKDYVGVLDKNARETLRLESDDSRVRVEDPSDERVRRSSSQKLLEWEKQARLLVTANQDSAAELPYLLDALRTAMGMKTRWGMTVHAEDEANIERLRNAIALTEAGKTFRAAIDLEAQDALAELKHHASGSLAPMIAKLRVGWPAELLAGGLTLVDLPGVGIASDVHKEVTHDWINANTRALVLVVDRAGVTESCTRLLTESGFFQRLLTAADDPASDPMSLFVAVTRVDDVARTRRHTDKTKRVREHFSDVAAELVPRMQGQLRQQLDALDVSSHELTGQRQHEVIKRVLAELQVFPVSATELQKIYADDEDAKPDLPDKESTNVPALGRALAAQAQSWKQRAAGREAETADNVRDRLHSLLKLTLAQWQDVNRAEEEALRLRTALDVHVAPLREELATLRGEFRASVKAMGSQSIDLLVEEALTAARKDMRKHVKPFRGYHYKTLQAAVRAGGVWDGARQINLPDKFADACEQPLVAIWGTQILERLRVETRDLANHYARLVEKVADWAGEQGAQIQADLVRQQRDAIRAEAKALERVGRDIVDDLREKVRKELHAAVSSVISSRCGQFISEHRHEGRGARDNMAELCDQLVDAVADGVRAKARERLKKNFENVEAEVKQHFRQMEDPIGAASDAIVARHEQRQKRSDAQRRKRVIETLESALAACPPDRGSFDFGDEDT